MIDHHIWRLRNRHRDLERLIRYEQRRPDPDLALIADLKRRKLQVKDQLFSAEVGLAPVAVRSSYR